MELYKNNAFTQEYFEQERQWFFERCKNIKTNRLSIETTDITGRLRGFLHKDFVNLKDIPIFKIDGKVWMSITPMEVQSHFIPIECATGRVGVAGLGIGYYVQRILDKEDVEEIVIYELEQDVIDLYLENFGPHPKLSFIIGDVLKNCKNKEFDWFYNDIYANGFDEKAFEHMKILTENNIIYDYHFWTMEGFIFSAMQSDTDVIPFTWKNRYFPFIINLLQEKEGLAEDILDTEESIELIENYRDSINSLNIK